MIRFAIGLMLLVSVCAQAQMFASLEGDGSKVSASFLIEQEWSFSIESDTLAGVYLYDADTQRIIRQILPEQRLEPGAYYLYVLTQTPWRLTISYADGQSTAPPASTAPTPAPVEQSWSGMHAAQATPPVQPGHPAASVASPVAPLPQAQHAPPTLQPRALDAASCQSISAGDFFIQGWLYDAENGDCILYTDVMSQDFVTNYLRSLNLSSDSFATIKIKVYSGDAQDLSARQIQASLGYNLAQASFAITQDLDCGDFPNQAAAQAALVAGDPHGLDGDGDGYACEEGTRERATWR